MVEINKYGFWYNKKVIIFGDEKVGKTSLISIFNKKNFKKNILKQSKVSIHIIFEIKSILVL